MVWDVAAEERHDESPIKLLQKAQVGVTVWDDGIFIPIVSEDLKMNLVFD